MGAFHYKLQQLFRWAILKAVEDCSDMETLYLADCVDAVRRAFASITDEDFSIALGKGREQKESDS